MPRRIEVAGIPIDPWTMAQTVEMADRYISCEYFAHFIGINADKLLQMKDDPWMDSCARRCEVINADGASMVLAARSLGNAVPERVAGVDLMKELCALAEKRKYKVYFLGAKDEAVKKTVCVLEREFPDLPVAGFRNGYFQESEFDAVVDEVVSTCPAIIFVGITSPKKERLIERFREKGAVGIFIGVGGSFDVVSGDIPRAPLWMQKANLEWFFRMVQEPERLAKRYIVGNIRFSLILVKEAWRRLRAK